MMFQLAITIDILVANLLHYFFSHIYGGQVVAVGLRRHCRACSDNDCWLLLSARHAKLVDRMQPLR
jgi:hypothetical protein